MNKRLNSILFLIGATVLNIVLMFFYFLAFLGVAGLFFPVRTGFFAQAVWVGLFILALAAAWFTYKWAFKIFKERVPMERYFDMQLFKDKWF